MCEKEYILSKDTLNTIYEHVFESETELCSYLELKSGKELKIIVDLLQEGDVTTGRKTCKNKGKSSGFLYHSHPFSSRSYPSTEDIVKVLKYDFKVSIIATRWGIYTIKNPIKQKIKEDEVDYYLKKILKNVDVIGRMENKKGFLAEKYLNPEDFKGDFHSKYYIKTLTDDEIKIIRDELENIHRFTKLTLNFCPWSYLLR
uniref:Uncharacterized protein n=1 Tax=viral metagenome TaxID=1070528 RepID=A0A6C0HD88_9ZZZZ